MVSELDALLRHACSVDMRISKWIGVDLDGTLAEYTGFVSPDHIGEPIPLMLERVKHWIANGIRVKIFTARVCDGLPATKRTIELWCLKHIGQVIEVTNSKDYGMIELWDDRAVRVVHNTGESCCAPPNNWQRDL